MCRSFSGTLAYLDTRPVRSIKLEQCSELSLTTALGRAERPCRAPLRDYRPRMKEVLKLQGLIAHATVRPPQLGVDDAERAELQRLAQFAGLLDAPPLRAAGD